MFRKSWINIFVFNFFPFFAYFLNLRHPLVIKRFFSHFSSLIFVGHFFLLNIVFLSFFLFRTVIYDIVCSQTNPIAFPYPTIFPHYPRKKTAKQNTGRFFFQKHAIGITAWAGPRADLIAALPVPFRSRDVHLGCPRPQPLSQWLDSGD